MEAAVGTKAEVVTTLDGAETGGNPSKERDIDKSTSLSSTALDVETLAGAGVAKDSTNRKKDSVVTGRVFSAVVTGAGAQSRAVRGGATGNERVHTEGIDPCAEAEATTQPPWLPLHEETAGADDDVVVGAGTNVPRSQGQKAPIEVGGAGADTGTGAAGRLPEPIRVVQPTVVDGTPDQTQTGGAEVTGASNDANPRPKPGGPAKLDPFVPEGTAGSGKEGSRGGPREGTTHGWKSAAGYDAGSSCWC